MEKELIVLEDNDRFSRIRTQCINQDYIRDFYMEQMNLSKSIAALEYFVDILMDILIKNVESCNLELSGSELETYEKVKNFHQQLASLKLNTNIWEVDWLYQIKEEANQTREKFFMKKIELGAGEALPINMQEPTN